MPEARLAQRAWGKRKDPHFFDSATAKSYLLSSRDCDLVVSLRQMERYSLTIFPSLSFAHPESVSDSFIREGSRLSPNSTHITE